LIRVIPVVFDRNFVHKTPPLEYPRRAVRMGVEGFVQLGFDINDQGRALNIVVEDAQPKRMFDKAATKFIKGIRFESPEEQGEPVSVTAVSMKIAFVL
jgi:protein TonB